MLRGGENFSTSPHHGSAPDYAPRHALFTQKNMTHEPMNSSMETVFLFKMVHGAQVKEVGGGFKVPPILLSQYAHMHRVLLS